MRKVFFVLFIFFLFTTTSFAKETVYLKCPEIIKEVRSSKGLRANQKLVKGGEVNRNYTKIIISKSSSRVTMYGYSMIMSVSRNGNYKGEKPVKSSVFSNVKGHIEDGKITVRHDGSLVEGAVKMTQVESYKFFKKGSNWEFTGTLIAKVFQGSSETLVFNVAYKVGAKCDLLTKEKFKSIIKKGE